MLTSEELFPLEYCFDGSCSSHLARSTRPPLYPLRICTIRIPFVSFSTFPSSRSRSRPHLLHGDIVLTRLGPCNLFVPRPAQWWRELRSAAILCHALSHSRSSPGFPAALAKSTLLCSQRRALTRVHQHCTANVSTSCGVPSWREIIPFFFFLFFLETREHTAPFALVMSLLTRRSRNCE